MRPVQLRASSTAASSMILASRTASRVGRCAASALGPVATEGCAATGGCACGWPLGLLGPALAARMAAPFRLALPPSLLGFLGRFLWIGSSPEPLQHTQTSNLRHLRHIWSAQRAAVECCIWDICTSTCLGECEFGASRVWKASCFRWQTPREELSGIDREGLNRPAGEDCKDTGIAGIGLHDGRLHNCSRIDEIIPNQVMANLKALSSVSFCELTSRRQPWWKALFHVGCGVWVQARPCAQLQRQH